VQLRGGNSLAQPAGSDQRPGAARRVSGAGAQRGEGGVPRVTKKRESPSGLSLSITHVFRGGWVVTLGRRCLPSPAHDTSDLCANSKVRSLDESAHRWAASYPEYFNHPPIYTPVTATSSDSSARVALHHEHSWLRSIPHNSPIARFLMTWQTLTLRSRNRGHEGYSQYPGILVPKIVLAEKYRHQSNSSSSSTFF
jgi:hypothetical protein